MAEDPVQPKIPARDRISHPAAKGVLIKSKALAITDGDVGRASIDVRYRAVSNAEFRQTDRRKRVRGNIEEVDSLLMISFV
jgi:hypothetical protein